MWLSDNSCNSALFHRGYNEEDDETVKQENAQPSDEVWTTSVCYIFAQEPLKQKLILTQYKFGQHLSPNAMQ